jgi:hypothetical protein
VLKTYISGNQVPFIKNSISIEDEIGGRTVTSFTAHTEVGTIFKKGQPVEIINDEAAIIFSGNIENSVEQRVTISGDMYHSITCVDYTYKADKRIIAKAYVNELAGDIVKDIIADKLADEGITEGDIQDGVVVKEAVFNYAKVTDCLNNLAEKAGFWWNIDENKQLNFVAKSTYDAPFVVSHKDIFKDSLNVERGNSQYRNTQYIKGGKDITDPITETRKGDGVTTAFVVGFPIAKVPTITLNGNHQTVGIRGLEQNKDWYWSKGDNTISQDESATALNDSDTLMINYQGEFDIVIKTFNQDEILNLQEIEGDGTGIVEEVDTEPQASSREVAFQSGNKKLEKYGTIGYRVTFRTWKEGLKAGQLLTVNFPEHQLNNTELLIESISIEEIDGLMEYSVVAVAGATNASWSKLFYAMAQKGEMFVVRENISESEILITLDTFSKTWEETEALNIFKEVYPSETLYPSNTLYPMFEVDRRVNYMSFYNTNGEFYRKQITKQEVTDGEIKLTVFVTPLEANDVDITHVAWFGGNSATSTIGTGIEVDKQVYSKTKTEIEALQIDKTDTRNFAPMSGTIKLTAKYFNNIEDIVDDLVSKSQ